MVKSAGVVMIDVFDNVLLARIRRRNSWEFPGGKLRRGETSIAAAIRETWEEVGIQLDISWLTTVCDDTALGVPFRTYVAMLPADTDTRIDVSRSWRRWWEISDAWWVSRQDALELINPCLRPRLEQVFAVSPRR